MLRVLWRINKYQFHSLWLDRTQDLPHWSKTRQSLHHRCRSNIKVVIPEQFYTLRNINVIDSMLKIKLCPEKRVTSRVSPKKKICVFPIAWSSKLGSVGRDIFFFFLNLQVC
jgi:hypothetical protein